MAAAASVLTTFVLLLAPPVTAPATNPATKPATAPASDLSVWRARNIESLRQIEADDVQGGALMWSLRINPSMLFDEQVADVRDVLAGIREATTQPDGARHVDRVLAALQLPEAQRLLAALANESFADEPDEQRVSVDGIAGDVVQMLGRRDGERIAAAVVPLLEQHARHQQRWDDLAFMYGKLAYGMLEVGRRAEGARYADLMVATLRAHPTLQDPRSGNADAISAELIHTVLAGLGRADEAVALAELYQGDQRLVYFCDLVAAAVDRDDCGTARAIVNGKLEPIDRETAQWVLEMLDGRPAPADFNRQHDDVRVAAAARLTRRVAHALARRGEVDGAAAVFASARGGDPIRSYDWAVAADDAVRSGKTDAALRAVRRIWDMRAQGDEAEREGTLADAIESAVVVGDVLLARQAFDAMKSPSFRQCVLMTRAYRRQGRVDEANEFLSRAYRVVREAQIDEGGPGARMAVVAVEARHIGAAAAYLDNLLLRAALEVEAMNDPFYFGPGAYGTVVSAALKINRPDLLDRMYVTLSRPLDRAIFASVVTAALDGGTVSADDLME